ncbi:MAG TPA: phosphohistidine phosphatase SixA [Burkholderiales bacterium]|jgi:phosphohistidine phosphatase
MDLILWRHAEAEEGGADLERALTGKGRKQAAHVAEWLLQRLPAKFTLLASPAKRAQQTAAALGVKIKTVDRLAPGARVADVLAAAGWPDHKGAVVVVGHQPDLGSAVAQLLSGSPADWSLKKGALAWIASRERDGEAQVVLRAAISPDLL